MAERRLYIHIGCHKTGTTSIQHHLAENGAALRAKGLHFFCDNRLTGVRELPDLHSWLDFVVPFAVVPHGLRLADPVGLRERLATVDGDIVVSSENFSFFFERQHVEDVREALSPVFKEIKIVCYIRRQDRHVVSHHQEGSKLHRFAEYDLFGHSTRAIPPFEVKHELYLDYHRRLSLWADAFGDRNVTVKIYDRRLLRDGDVVEDFFHLLGVPEYRRVGDRNSSLSLRDAKLGHLVNGSDLNSKHALVSALGIGDARGKRMLPARAEARAYYERFLESNARLNARFGILPGRALFEEDFDDYPETPEDLWTEESANQTLLRLLRTMEGYRPEGLVEELRDVALAIGDSRPDMAVRLLQLALKLRPDGPLIRRKLAEYGERVTVTQAEKGKGVWKADK